LTIRSIISPLVFGEGPGERSALFYLQTPFHPSGRAQKKHMGRAYVLVRQGNNGGDVSAVAPDEWPSGAKNS